MTSTCDESIVSLFSALDRSLLQYLGEANPWTDFDHAAAPQTLRRLAANQRQSAAETADLLARRHLLPDTATYPAEFTRLHYVSLDFAIDRLITNQLGVVAAAAEALLVCARDPAARLLQRVRGRETEHLSELHRIRDSLRRPASAAG
jgi:hypothetical protein